MTYFNDRHKFLQKEQELLHTEVVKYGIDYVDTPRSKDTGILGSTRPLKLDSLRYLVQRWDSPRQVLQVGTAAQRTGSQALTFGLPDRSCIAASPVEYET